MNISKDELTRVLRDHGVADCRIDDVVHELYPCDDVEHNPAIPHKGAGVFVRTFKGYPDYADDHLAWASVCVLNTSWKRGRDEAWWKARRDAGVELSAWHWFPNPADPTKNVADAIKFAAENGAKSFLMNCEKEFFGKHKAAEKYAEFCAEKCYLHGLKLGLSSYAVASNFRSFPWEVFAKYCDFGSPQIYDREGGYDPNYPVKGVESWKARGFEHILPSCGIFQGDRSSGKWKFRSRRPDEVKKHLNLFPKHEVSLAWPLAGKPPEATLEAYGSFYK